MYTNSDHAVWWALPAGISFLFFVPLILLGYFWLQVPEVPANPLSPAKVRETVLPLCTMENEPGDKCVLKTETKKMTKT